MDSSQKFLSRANFLARCNKTVTQRRGTELTDEYITLALIASQCMC